MRTVLKGLNRNTTYSVTKAQDKTNRMICKWVRGQMGNTGVRTSF